MEKIKVIIVDDHTIVREGLEELLSKSDEIEVIALASDGEEAIQVCKDKKPDVVIMDVQGICDLMKELTPK